MTSKDKGKSKVKTHRVPLVTHDYRQDPTPYPALKTEQGVFTTPPYSAAIKGKWRFKDEEAAKESSEGIWEMFCDYRDDQDFIGMDTARKFIQMGRTRSLRYALRKGGRKYDEEGEVMERTGKVYDKGKLAGANVFEKVLERCWADETYKTAWERWKAGDRDVFPLAALPAEGGAEKEVKGRGAKRKEVMDEEEVEEEAAPQPKGKLRKPQAAGDVTCM